MSNKESGGKTTIDFLIAEYNEISQETRRLRQEGITRLNFFITITSSILAVLVFLSQNKTTPDGFFQAAAIGVLLLLLLVGIDTFRFTISRDISTDFNIRATNRIRRFFATQSPEIQQYLTWQCHDEPTVWITRNTSGVRSTVQYISSFICAVIVGLALDLLRASLAAIVIVGSGVLVGAFISFQRYAVRRFKQASIIAKESIRFSASND